MNLLKLKKLSQGLVAILVLTFLLATAWSFYAKSSSSSNFALASGGSSGNVSGFAWSNNFGWVSLNSRDCDINNNGTFEGPAETPTPAPDGCPLSGGATAYSVNIDNSGNFLGYAWSENLGWINFGPTSGYPTAPNSAAHYDSVSGKVTGWAQVLSLGADGWLKLGDATWASQSTSINSGTGEFNGFAWNGNVDTTSGLGWLSFNCSTGGASGENICVSNSNYKVVVTGLNPAPSVTNLSAPNWGPADACSVSGAKRAILRWNFVGSAQSAYQVIISTSTATSSPVVDTGKVLSETARQYLVSSLAWNTAYYWWVRVWDDTNATSSWVQYNNSPDTDNNDGALLTFTTYKHEFPDSAFSFSPTKPANGQTVAFTDHSSVYLTASPATAITASTTNATWAWSFSGGVPSVSIAANPQSAYSSIASSSASVIITDQDNYQCGTSTVFSANVEQPNWLEVKPK